MAATVRPSPAIPPPIKRAVKCLLHVRVIEGKNLIAADSNGRSDPYVKLSLGGAKTQKTNRVEKSLHPVWNQEFSFEVAGTLPDSLVLEVYDHDAVGTDDYLGQVTYVLSKDLATTSTLTGWQFLRDKKGGVADLGSINVAIVLEDNPSDVITVGSGVELRRATLLNALQSSTGAREEKGTPLRLLTGTWNVGNKAPPEGKGNFNDWLIRGSDIYIIGTQECEYPARKLGSVQADFEATICEFLNDGPEGHAYAIIKNHSLREMRIFGFARKTVLARIGKIEVGTEATGLGDVIGNKGGVALAFKVDDLSLCFISSHLAAHQHKTLQRNSDYKQIVNGLHFGEDKMDIHTQFHHVFWVGDLNYRVNTIEQGEKKAPEAAHFAKLCRDITEGKLKAMFDGNGPDLGDQLTNERKSGRAFVGYQEGNPSTFRPTFKVERGKVVPEYDHERSPAWCDRVLWKSQAGFDVKQIAYNSAESVTTSDHKPVYAIFELSPYVLPSAIDDNLGACTILIKSLRAHGIPAGDIGGTSDGYLTVHAPFLPKAIKTSVKNNTLTPDWGDELGVGAKVLAVTVNNPRRLARSQIQIKLWDSDPTKDSVLAYTTIPLAAAVSGAVTDFRVDFTSGGLLAGVLQGTIQLTWAAAAGAPAKR